MLEFPTAGDAYHVDCSTFYSNQNVLETRDMSATATGGGRSACSIGQQPFHQSPVRNNTMHCVKNSIIARAWRKLARSQISNCLTGYRHIMVSQAQPNTYSRSFKFLQTVNSLIFRPQICQGDTLKLSRVSIVFQLYEAVSRIAVSLAVEIKNELILGKTYAPRPSQLILRQ